MIYWKQTDVFGLPPEGELVFIYFQEEICEATLIELGDGLFWDRVVCYIIDEDGRHPVTIHTPLSDVTDWSEKNAPLTFHRKPMPAQGEQA